MVVFKGLVLKDYAMEEFRWTFDAPISATKYDNYNLDNSIVAKAKIATLMCRIEPLEVSGTL